VRRPQTARPAFAAFVLTLALIGAGGLISLLHFGFDVVDTLDAGSYAALLVGMSVIGLLIARREPGNPVGWLFSLAPLLVCLSLTLGAIGVWAGPEHRDYPWAAVPAWLSLWAWPFGLIGFALFMPLLFPDGRPPPGRWRILVRIDLVVIGATALLLATQPGEINAGVVNPLGVAAAGTAPAIAAVVVAVILSMIAGFVSAVVRYRQAGPTQRVQLRECLFAVCLTFTGFVLITAISAPDVLYNVDYALIPGAVGLAMLRYRLYDVDVVIRRTLVYAVLVIALAAVYLAGIGLFGMILRAAAGIQSSFAVTLSTLAVALAFQPLRRRIGATVDRRFYRARYDAARTLDAFSARMRGEIDLETLTGEVVSVVCDALHPSQATVWLRPSEDGR
jgi:hypothetical protein